MRTHSYPVTGSTEAAARRWLALPPPRPVQPAKPSATVLLVRPQRPAARPDPGDLSPLEVFVLHRQPTMAFAAGMVVFPGGGRDPGDRSIEETAIRETFEECGVLLADDGAGAFPDDLAGLEESRQRLLNHTSTLAEVVDAAGLRLRPDLLVRFARWITPEFSARRFDTWFFAAPVPPGQQARWLGGEASHAEWASPATLLNQPRTLMPPTRVALEDLAATRSLADLTSAQRSMDPVLPVLSDLDGTLYLTVCDPR